MNVQDLRILLGNDVLLLAWPLCSKGTKRKWGDLTIADMTPAYVAKLERGNIGVALGEKSGNLVALDIDTDDLVQPFIDANPFLNATLQTHGARGCVFWFRLAGEYPKTTKKLKTQSGEDCGEWRAGKNSQSIIHGIHPDTGQPYQIVNNAKPVSVDFASIVWPKEISNPPVLESQSFRTPTDAPVIQSDREPESQSQGATDVTDAIACCASFVLSVDHAVQLAIPNSIHQNNDRLFTLARAVKSLELQAGQFTPPQLRDVFNRWYNLAAEFSRPELTRDDYLTQFLNAYASAKVPLGEGVISKAWKLANEKPSPDIAIKNFEDRRLHLVVALCRELQIIAGMEPFYLSARTVQGLMKLESHITAARWLRSLCVLQILKETEKGSGIRASRYRYLVQIE